MGCRIGMATDVAERIQSLKDDRKVPSHATYLIENPFFGTKVKEQRELNG